MSKLYTRVLAGNMDIIMIISVASKLVSENNKNIYIVCRHPLNTRKRSFFTPSNNHTRYVCLFVFFLRTYVDAIIVSDLYLLSLLVLVLFMGLPLNM